MENKVLLYISLASAILGLAIVYIASENVELEITSIGRITHDDIGKNAKVCGEITSLFTSKTNHIFFKVGDHTGEIDVVVFNSSVEKLHARDLENNEIICISGKIDEYEDKLEIIPDEISKG